VQSLTTRLMKTAGQGTQRLAFTASSVQERVAAANWILMCQQKEVASRVTSLEAETYLQIFRRA